MIILPPQNFNTSTKQLLLPEIKATMADKSLADPILLETIDKLFQLNIGEYISLPQVSPCDLLTTWGSKLIWI